VKREERLMLANCRPPTTPAEPMLRAERGEETVPRVALRIGVRVADRAAGVADR
jgi:hypothetical protein